MENLRGAFLFSANQDRHPVAPDVLQLPGLERPALFCRGEADVPQLPAVRALARLGRSLNFKVAVITYEYHLLHPPVVFR